MFEVSLVLGAWDLVLTSSSIDDGFRRSDALERFFWHAKKFRFSQRGQAFTVLDGETSHSI
jgi:hypothetical protein